MCSILYTKKWMNSFTHSPTLHKQTTLNESPLYKFAYNPSYSVF